MTGPVDTTQDEPQDPQAYRHQLLLLKSAHCCRPVIHEGLQQFINSLTLYRGDRGLAMTVYLTGKRDGIDSKDIQIKTNPEPA